MIGVQQSTDVREQRVAAGHWIRRSREAAGLVQADLARELGVVPATISSYETGRNGLDERHIPALARTLGKTVTETRRALGRYVPEDAPNEPPARPSVLRAIMADPTLLPEAKAHLISQYGLLQRLQVADPAAVDRDEAVLDVKFDGWERDEA